VARDREFGLEIGNRMGTVVIFDSIGWSHGCIFTAFIWDWVGYGYQKDKDGLDSMVH
jgi:hypothetical protein